MKAQVRLLTGLFLVAALCMVADTASAQKRDNKEARPSPNAVVGQTIGTTEVMITYGRPSAKGRKVFGELEKFGSVWRTGANEATTISFSNAVKVEGKALPAGTYSLFTIPGEKEWTVIFNKTATQWGAFRYDDKQDALRVKVTPAAAAHSEHFTISFDEVTDKAGTLALRWDKTRVPVRIAVN